MNNIVQNPSNAKYRKIRISMMISNRLTVYTSFLTSPVKHFKQDIIYKNQKRPLPAPFSPTPHGQPWQQFESQCYQELFPKNCKNIVQSILASICHPLTFYLTYWGHDLYFYILKIAGNPKFHSTIWTNEDARSLLLLAGFEEVNILTTYFETILFDVLVKSI